MFKKLKGNRDFGIVSFIILVSVIITLKNNTFLRIDNIFDLLKGNVVLGIMAMGMLLVILTGGIDVSVASMVAALTVITGNFSIHVSDNLFLIFLVACTSGVIIGAVNGLLITKLEIPPIVATLGTMSIIFGLILYLTNGVWITGIPETLTNFGKITVFKIFKYGGGVIGIPIQIFFFLGASLLTWAVLRFTLIGRGIYAVGGNAESAKRLGFNSDRIKIFVYSYVGFMNGIAAIINTSIMRQVDPNAYIGFELQVIAAVILGGASILGGSGSVLGTVLGVLLFSILGNGLILMHIPSFWHKIVIGIIILLAISITMLQQRKLESSRIKVDIDESEKSGIAV